MGTQQLLIIVLSVIIVGIAIACGISLFQRQAMLSHRQEIISAMNSVVSEAIVYKKMPVSLGGGSGSFVGFTPAGAEPYSNPSGSHSSSFIKQVTNDVNYFIELWAEGSYPQRIKIIASSKTYGQGNYWTNVNNALITASYDANGKIIIRPPSKGFVISGNW